MSDHGTGLGWLLGALALAAALALVGVGVAVGVWLL